MSEHHNPSFCRLTGATTGALSTTAIWDVGAADVLEACFRPKGKTKPSQMELTDVLFGQLIDPEEPEDIGEDVVVARMGCHEYVIHGHGGSAATARTDRILSNLGARQSDVTAWRTYKNVSPEKQKILNLLQQAPTYRTAMILLDQYNGAASRTQERIAELRLNGEESQVLALETQFRQTRTIAEHLISGWRVVFIGKPNVGKSSLLNAILGCKRAIVNSQQGTTRDLVQAQKAIDGWLFEFIDAAGIRETADELEREGVNRAKAAIEKTDLVLRLFDDSDSMADISATRSNEQFRNKVPTLDVINKCDLSACPPTDNSVYRISAVTGEGIEELLAGIVNTLIPNPPQPGDGIDFGV